MKYLKFLFIFMVSLFFCYLTYRHSNFSQFDFYLAKFDSLYFYLAVLLIFPTIFFSSLKWFLLNANALSLIDSIRLILTSNALNLFLPGRAGDFLKIYFAEGQVYKKQLFSLVVIEKLLDLWSLLILFFIGVLCHFQLEIPLLLILTPFFLNFLAVLFFKILKLKSLKKITLMKLFGILNLNILLWFIHVAQFFIFLKAININDISLLSSFYYVPIIIISGLIPISYQGIGIRDFAIKHFLGPFVFKDAILCIGLFSLLRIFLPGLLGINFLFNSNQMSKNVRKYLRDKKFCRNKSVI